MASALLLPTGRTRRSCSTRSSFACRLNGMSPISSRNMRSAAGVLKQILVRSRSAPVKAPLA